MKTPYAFHKSTQDIIARLLDIQLSAESIREIFNQSGDSYPVRLAIAQHPQTPADILKILIDLAKTDEMKAALVTNPNLHLQQFISLINTPNAFDNPSAVLFLLEEPTLIERFLERVSHPSGITQSAHQEMVRKLASKRVDLHFKQLRKKAAQHNDDHFLERFRTRLTLYYIGETPRIGQWSTLKVNAKVPGALEWFQFSMQRWSVLEQQARMQFKKITCKQGWFIDNVDGPEVETLWDLLWYADENYKTPRTFQEAEPGLWR